ncbi:hypothetical protein ETAA8_32880 [Anatilimnocola aggregata]|uniref:Uncharacterized protein n=1 Tax=Anatilimnocola aggregata TaxID=2528021 RepID=A0A517YD83_9BACT|nr:hypothetical protein [Anatilimnocola aggregata]QDU28188.1 hypothetical protein ETAA8_32880 [Anatilimnocola aggregata]
MKLLVTMIAFALIGLSPLSATRAQGTAAEVATSWELTPYHIQLAVFVEPSARLLPNVEAALQAQLIAQANATLGGPWQVSAADKFAALRSHLLLTLIDVDALPLQFPANDKSGPDKVLLVTVREQGGKIDICAREWDVTCQAWNVPVVRTTQQVGRLPAEASAAIVAAFAPLARIDAVDQDKVTLKLKAGNIPRRDGTYLTIGSTPAFRPFILARAGEQQAPSGTAVLVPWTYLAPQMSTVVTTGTKRANFRAKLHTGLRGTILPEYHPRQVRLALGISQGSAVTTVKLVDEATSAQPLEGYEVIAQALATSNVSAEKPRLGASDRNGELIIPPTTTGLQRLTVKHGGEELVSVPFIAGLQSRLQLALASDRRRLELAAALAELNDDLLDLVAKQGILALQMKEALLKRDFTQMGSVAAELKAVGRKDRYSARLAEITRSVAGADEATRRKLEPQVAEAKRAIEQLLADQ